MEAGEATAATSYGSQDLSYSSSYSSSSHPEKVERQNLQRIVEGRACFDASWKQTDLTIQIPSRGNSPRGAFPHVRIFGSNIITDEERSSLLNSELPGNTDCKSGPDSALSAEILSWKRCTSLPTRPASNLSPSVCDSEGTNVEQQVSQKRKTQTKVSRSLSVPMRNIVIVRSGSFPHPKNLTIMNSPNDQQDPASVKEEEEEIPEEEAVCRICLIGLHEGGNWLKMECSCKGDLRLSHEDCAVKWFSIRGNKRCEVCGQEVLNLPVTLLRVQSSSQRDDQQNSTQNSTSFLSRSWQDVVVLILLSTMCYFFFLEQLLVNDMGYHAIMVATPFSLTLGLLGSVVSVVLACNEYVWTYAAFQFSLVVIFLHLFYSVINLKVVLAILLASIVGFGIAMGTNSCLQKLFSWRASLAQAQHNVDLV